MGEREEGVREEERGRAEKGGGRGRERGRERAVLEVSVASVTFSLM